MKRSELKILLIEDNPGDARLVKEAFAEAPSTKVELVHASRLQEGLQKAKEQPFDVVLLDLSLPDASGLDTIRQAHRALSAIPIIVLTGFNDESFAITVVHEGAQDFLVKGMFDSALLLRSIRYAIERKQSQEQLKTSREFALNIIDSSLDMIIAVDAGGLIAEFNKAAQKSFGYSPDEILGKPVSMLYASGDDAKRIWDRTRFEGKCVGQIQHLRKDGLRFPASFSASLLREGPDEFSGIVYTSRDITEQINLEAQLRHAQKMDSIGQLAAGVAHDFNNILTVIQGYASLLLLRPDLAPDLTEPLSEISTAGEHAASLTRQLLTFSRKQAMQMVPLDLNTVLKNVSRMLTRLIGEEITLEVHPGKPVPPVLGDAGMIEQVIINLVVNARDAMRKGGQIRITTDQTSIDANYVRTRPEARVGNFARLSVGDSGTGMDAATLNRIFEPFFTTKEAGKGTGLGLATVYGIVQSHLGWIEVESALGVGTEFRVFLPVIEDTTQGPVKPALTDRECRGTEKILVVEDVEELRRLVCEILESYGYRVAEARDGVEASKLWPELKDEVSLLLTDVVLPEGMSGRDLAEKLREENPSLKVIFTSGHGVDLVRAGFNLNEGSHFLQKPYSALTLAQNIRACLDGV